MKLCVVSSKECWQDESGRWVTTGGFPLQVAALGSLFSEVTLVILAAKRQKGGSPLPSDACVVPLPKPGSSAIGRKLALLALVPRVMPVIRREVARADVVYSPLPGDISLLGFLTALALKKRLIARYSSSWPATPHQSFMNRVTKFLTRKFAGGRSVMLATGAGEQPPARNMHWIFATAITEADVTQVHPQFDRGISSPARLAFLGRLSPEKGIDVLIQAVARLKAEGFQPLPAIELIGDGPLRHSLKEQAARAGVKDEFIFVGQLSRNTLTEYLNTVDMAVLPSLTESFCKARLDAMLCGLPVITTETGFGREIIGEDGERGWLAKSGDPASLANAIRLALTAPTDWPAMRRRCRTFGETYTLEDWARQIASLCARQWNIQYDGGKLHA